MLMKHALLRTPHLLFNNVASLANVQTIQELSDILVPYSAYLLDVGCGLGDVLEGFTVDFDLILDVFRCLDGHTGVHLDMSDEFLTQEVSVVESVFYT